MTKHKAAPLGQSEVSNFIAQACASVWAREYARLMGFGYSPAEAARGAAWAEMEARGALVDLLVEMDEEGCRW
jgi:hypothetical protein